MTRSMIPKTLFVFGLILSYASSSILVSAQPFYPSGAGYYSSPPSQSPTGSSYNDDPRSVGPLTYEGDGTTRQGGLAFLGGLALGGLLLAPATIAATRPAPQVVYVVPAAAPATAYAPVAYYR